MKRLLAALLILTAAAPRVAAVIPAGTVASDATTRGVEDPESDRRQLGAPHVLEGRFAGATTGLVPGPARLSSGGGAPTHSPTVRVPASPSGALSHGRTGVIAQAIGHGADYLAIPIGPGHRVRVCGPGACLVLVPTDAGPNHERLVAGRIADVALGHWRTICGLPAARGTCRGSWSLVDVLPETDTEETSHD